MARPTKRRRICAEPEYNLFIPFGGDDGKKAVSLTLDEFEVIRLIDFERRTHEQCARQMDIARTTVTETYDRARFKIAASLVNGKPLRINGGNYKVCGGYKEGLCNAKCNKNIYIKGENDMRIAVTYDNGNVFQHFGHTEQFKLYDVKDGVIESAQVVSASGNGHGALAGFLTELKADTLICGGIGQGAKNALAEVGITLYGGVTGNADEAAKAFLTGKLQYNPEVKCNHHHDHGEGHTCGEHEHTCGEHGHSCGNGGER